MTSSLLKKPSAAPLPRWSLEHRLLRAPPPPQPAAAASTDPKLLPHQHILSLSHHPGKTYLYIPANTTTNAATSVAGAGSGTGSASGAASGAGASGGATPGPVVAIPAAQAEPFVALLTSKQSALWTHRQTHSVRDGAAFQVGECIVRAGEVRMPRPGSGGQHLVQGVVVCIETELLGGEEGEEDAEVAVEGDVVMGEGDGDGGEKGMGVEAMREARETIRGLWKDLGVEGGKEGVKEVMSNYAGAEEEQARWAEVRMWCEVLRLRA